MSRSPRPHRTAPPGRPAAGPFFRFSPAAAWLGIAGAALWGHARFAGHAGGLWRDESNTLALAAMPTLRELWRSLPYDSAPPAIALLARLWLQLGLRQDGELRVLGALIGLAVLGAVALSGRVTRSPLPLASGALFALNAWVIRGGDALRPQGLAMLAVTLAFATAAAHAARPTFARLAMAAAAFALAVQCAWTTLPLLGAIALAALAVARLTRSRERALGSAAMLAAAALSALPYAGAVASAAQWGELLRSGLRFSPLLEALRATAPADLALWAVALATALLVLARAIRSPLAPLAPDEGRRAVFAGVTLVSGTLGTFAAFAWSRLPTQPWYWLPLLTLAAVCMDALLAPLVRRPAARVTATAALLVLTAWHAVQAAAPLAVRQTNMDLIAARVTSMASPADLVVVAPWQLGVSFHRYASARTRWLTLPPLPDSRIHRYDLIREAMLRPAGADSVTAAVWSTLGAGGRVFVVGGLPPVRRGERAPLPPRAPAAGLLWSADGYNYLWGRHLVSVVMPRVRNVEEVAVETREPVSAYENAALIVLDSRAPR